MRRVFFILLIFILVLGFFSKTDAEVIVVTEKKSENDLWNLYVESIKKEIENLQKDTRIFNTYYIRIKPLKKPEEEAKEVICIGVLITTKYEAVLEAGYTCGVFARSVMSEEEAIEYGRALGRTLFSIILLEYEKRDSI